jgi:hypothetical protein
MARSAECPHCHAMNDVPPSNIGQYVTCEACRCKYYVYVPPVEPTSSHTITAPPTPRPVEAVSQHSESHVMMRQEALLAEIHDDLIDLRRRLTIACFLLVAAASAVITVILLR